MVKSKTHKANGKQLSFYDMIEAFVSRDLWIKLGFAAS